ncbi:hypothetical protein C8R46DRAFT_1273143 [Mycena filopes]|nr:hypothetical protein C8R46DRAFT_1273143 [Mycena filopes]
MPQENIPKITDVYHAGGRLKLYEPKSAPDLPEMEYAGEPYCQWPRLRLSQSEYQRISQEPLKVCYEHDIPYNTQKTPITLELTRPLAAGDRETRLAQVWQAKIPGSATSLVARMYDPLYFATTAVHRFLRIERAVAVETEVYQRLLSYQGTMIPKFRGLFVAEIPCLDRPRHIYTVLLEYIDGRDLQEMMGDSTAAKVCSLHKASLMNDVAKAAYILYDNGLHPGDLMDRNTILQLPATASDEDFCVTEECPWRKKIRINLGNDLKPPAHLYAPRIFFIDLEDFAFNKLKRSLSLCRECLIRDWYVPWLWHENLLSFYN